MRTRSERDERAGRFIVGFTDLHPGGDRLAAVRDSQAPAIELIETRTE
jgi:hypothetical protein